MLNSFPLFASFQNKELLPQCPPKVANKSFFKYRYKPMDASVIGESSSISVIISTHIQVVQSLVRGDL